MRNFLLPFALTVVLSLAFVMPPETPPVLVCPAPANVGVSAKGIGSITFDWDDCSCQLNGYLVSYYRQGDAYSSPVYGTASSSYGYTGLPAGTYDFFFQTDCGSELSDMVVIEDQVVQ